MTCTLPRVALAFAFVVPVLQVANPTAEQPTPSTAPRAIAFIDVSVLPMDREGLLEGQTVVVREGRVAALGPASSTTVPEGALRVDGRGHVLMPGLAEMHSHVPGGKATDAAIERVLFLYVANGITTARGMLGDPRHLPLRERLARGEVTGPRLYTSGPSFNGNSATTPEAAERMVREQKAAGYDFLKIHPGVKREVFDALAATASQEGIRFAGHVPLDVGLARALEARFATIDHVDGYVEALLEPDAPVKTADSQWFGVNLAPHADTARIPELVAATRRAGTWIVPTESLLMNTVGDTDPRELAARPEMKYVSPEQVQQWTEAKQKFLQQPAASRHAFLGIRKQLLKALHAGGVGLLLGSDAPQMWNVPGFSIHQELQLMVEAGLTPWQALETGTRNVAKFFGTERETGTVTVGKRADLVLLAGNPAADISNTRKIAGVVAGGRWLPKSEIDARLKSYEMPR